MVFSAWVGVQGIAPALLVFNTVRSGRSKIDRANFRNCMPGRIFRSGHPLNEHEGSVAMIGNTHTEVWDESIHHVVPRAAGAGGNAAIMRGLSTLRSA